MRQLRRANAQVREAASPSAHRLQLRIKNLGIRDAGLIQHHPRRDEMMFQHSPAVSHWRHGNERPDFPVFVMAGGRVATLGSGHDAGALTRLAELARIMAAMARRHLYTLAFAFAVTEHLQAIDAKYHSLIHENIGEQLRFEPGTETRNRKPLRQPGPFGASWETRFGPANRFRVLYDIDEEAHLVRIMAIGEKQRERLFVGGEEVQL